MGLISRQDQNDRASNPFIHLGTDRAQTSKKPRTQARGREGDKEDEGNALPGEKVAESADVR